MSTTYMAPCGGSVPFPFPVPHRGSRACLSWPFVSGVAGRGTARAGGLAGTDPPPPNLRGDLWACAVASRQEIVPRRQILPSRLLPVEGQTGQLFMRLVSHLPTAVADLSRKLGTSNRHAIPSTSRILLVEGVFGAPNSARGKRSSKPSVRRLILQAPDVACTGFRGGADGYKPAHRISPATP